MIALKTLLTVCVMRLCGVALCLAAVLAELLWAQGFWPCFIGAALLIRADNLARSLPESEWEAVETYLKSKQNQFRR